MTKEIKIPENIENNEAFMEARRKPLAAVSNFFKALILKDLGVDNSSLFDESLEANTAYLKASDEQKEGAQRAVLAVLEQFSNEESIEMPQLQKAYEG